MMSQSILTAGPRAVAGLRAAALLLFIFSSQLSYSKDLFLYGDLSFGGDKIADTESDRDIDAGGFMHLAIGKEKALENDLILSGSFGMKFDAIFIEDQNGDDGTALFIRFPIEVILDKRFDERQRIGAGLSYQLSPNFDVSDERGGEIGGYSFKNALGILANYSYQFGESAYVGLKYTAIDYQLRRDGTGRGKIDGNSASVFLKLSL